MLGAGLDGIKKKIEPGDPVDEDIYKLDSHKRKQYGIRELPGSLKEAVDYLNTDYMFLKGPFTADLLDKYTELKVDENLQTSLRPSPYGFARFRGREGKGMAPGRGPAGPTAGVAAPAPVGRGPSTASASRGPCR